MKYIDAEKLKAEIQRRSMHDREAITADEPKYRTHYKLGRYEGLRDLIDMIDSLQQDETQVDKMLSSQIWWEEQGWIMIPPDATIEGIDSLLREVKKKLQQEQPESSRGKFVFPNFLYARTVDNKTLDVSYAPQSLDAVEYIRNDSLQQELTPDTDALHAKLVNLLKTYRIGEETARTMADRISDTYGAQRYMDGLCDGLDKEDTKQPNDVCAEIKEYYGEDLAFEDERTKAAYHFFSAGKSFALRQYAEEREKHITDLLNNFQKGMNAGYEKAKSELKDRKIECNPIIKEFIEKFISIGAANNFGFGPKNFQLEQPEVDLEKFTEKIKTFQRRYKYPEIVSIKGAMTFMARMFYQYPNVAKQWYEQLPKVTMD